MSDHVLSHGVGLETAMQSVLPGHLTYVPDYNLAAIRAIECLDLSGENKLFIGQFTDIATAKSIHAAWERLSAGTSHKMLLMPPGHTISEASDEVLAACGLMRAPQ